MSARKEVARALVAVLGLLWPGGVAAQPADLIIANASIHGDGGTAIRALAVRDGTIAALGPDAEVLALRGPATRLIDAQGRTLIPGLIDSHIHAIRAGLSFTVEASFIGTRTIGEAMARISTAAARAPGGGWIIVAGGWTPQQFAENRLPTRAEVEAAAPGRPVYVQLFYRAALLTHAGVAAMGLARDGLPDGATEQTDAGNRPTGWIGGTARAITAIYERLPRIGLDQQIEGTRAFFAELNRLGVTGISDPGGHNLAPDQYEALFRLWRAGGLTLRVAYTICAPTPGRELAEYRAYTRFLPTGTGDDWLRFNGIGERVTWGLYNNDAPDAKAIAAFEDVALWAARQRHTLTVHWNNDRSAHYLLDILDRVNAKVPLAPLRWSIAHLHDAAPATLARLRALGLGWLSQDSFHFAAADFLGRMDPDRRKASPPLVSALRAGVPVGAGTDAHRVMDYNPFVALQWMLDGRTVDGRTTRDRAEIPSRAEALRMWTEGSAWFVFADRRRGRLAPGMAADFALLSKDYWTVPVAEIGSIESLLTVVGGRVVHAGGPFAAR